LKSYLDTLLNKNIVIEKEVSIQTFFDFAYEYLNYKKRKITKATFNSYRQTLVKLETYSKVHKIQINFGYK
jgi:hypothetical protein